MTDRETVANLKNMVLCFARTTPGRRPSVRVTFKGHDLMDEEKLDYAVKLSLNVPLHAMGALVAISSRSQSSKTANPEVGTASTGGIGTSRCMVARLH